jgi:hypothetical protein
MAAGYRLFKQLAPGAWYNSIGPVEYRQRYHDEILARLDRARVITELEAMAGGRAIALLCFEHPNGHDWCHRAMAAAWLADALGEPVSEFGFEALPQERHPLMPG